MSGPGNLLESARLVDGEVEVTCAIKEPSAATRRSGSGTIAMRSTVSIPIRCNVRSTRFRSPKTSRCAVSRSSMAAEISRSSGSTTAARARCRPIFSGISPRPMALMRRRSGACGIGPRSASDCRRCRIPSRLRRRGTASLALAGRAIRIRAVLGRAGDDRGDQGTRNAHRLCARKRSSVECGISARISRSRTPPIPRRRSVRTPTAPTASIPPAFRCFIA